jgi:opacity protein-like surface antigen
MKKRNLILFLVTIFILSSSYVSAQPEIGGFSSFGLSYQNCSACERGDFTLGATEIGFVWELKGNLAIEAVGVFEPTGDVGLEAAFSVNNIFKDTSFILGYFDSPFGLEPTYWDAPDNPFNSLSILQEFVLEEYGQVGARMNIAKESFDFDLYVGNGFRSELFEDNDTSKPIGTYFNFKPGGIFNIGGSFSGNLIKKGDQESLMLAGGHAGIVSDGIDFISEYAARMISSRIESQGIYSMVTLKLLDPLYFAVRGGLVYDDRTRIAYSASAGAGYTISEHFKVKADYRYRDDTNAGLEHLSQVMVVVSY